MRFVITGEWKNNQLLRLVLIFFLVFISLFWVTSLLIFLKHMSFSYDSIVAHYLGTPSPWGDPATPRSYTVMLEVTHGHLMAMGLLIMTMTHLILFIPTKGSIKALLTAVTFLSALGNEGSNWLIRYVSPEFAYLKLAMFSLFQLSLGLIIVLLFLALFRNWPNHYGNKKKKTSA